jgi:type IV secretion system protein VirB1
MPIDLSSLVHECAPTVGPHTMAAIVRTESNGNPWRIGDNTSGVSFTLPSKALAVARAADLAKQGHNIDIGLGQINIHNLPVLGITIDQAFDPCTNIQAASRVLAWGYQRAITAHESNTDALFGAISAYNTGSLTEGFKNGYVQRVTHNADAQVRYNAPTISPYFGQKPASFTVSTFDSRSAISDRLMIFAKMLTEAALGKSAY